MGGSGQSGGAKSENTLFGENTARGIVIIALSAEKVGTIMHANEEMYRILGFNRKDLIQKNVSCLQPPLISHEHDSFLRRFLETARREVLNHQRTLLA